jgi:hypothetical protein
LIFGGFLEGLGRFDGRGGGKERVDGNLGRLNGLLSDLLKV